MTNVRLKTKTQSYNILHHLTHKWCSANHINLNFQLAENISNHNMFNMTAKMTDLGYKCCGYKTNRENAALILQYWFSYSM